MWFGFSFVLFGNLSVMKTCPSPLHIFPPSETLTNPQLRYPLGFPEPHLGGHSLTLRRVCVHGEGLPAFHDVAVTLNDTAVTLKAIAGNTRNVPLTVFTGSECGVGGARPVGGAGQPMAQRPHLAPPTPALPLHPRGASQQRDHPATGLFCFVSCPRGSP